ncbi:MAG: DUF4336 domain-containing protein [Symploca sp. SIO1C2]|nr:DUF4336 domain-containing protein [Symploca sp. SIO1C2]
MLRNIDTNLWVAEQPLKYFGLEVGTRMTVIRFNPDKLLVISPINPEEKMIHQLEQLGTVNYIISPNLYHHLFIAPFKKNYPDAELWATSGLKEKCPNLPIDKVFNDECTHQFLEKVEVAPVNGFKTLDVKGYSPLNEWVFFHTESNTLIITDIAYYFDAFSSPIMQLLTKLFGGYQQLRPSFLEKIATHDKEQVKQSIKRILSWDFERVIMAHGSILEQDAKQQFQLGYEWFLGETI